jgi:hypothetical protein
MRKIILTVIATIFFGVGFHFTANACTNYLITKGASADGSTMISYSADSHVLYGELYHWPAGIWPEGTMMDVVEWDSGKYLGKIKQARQTYNVVGNINEYQLAIGETTFTGLEILESQEGSLIDYGSLIYITLQRAKTAREAIKVFHELTSTYGYHSTGESFSIADPNEVWILEMIGKGNGYKGAVWVARMVPDGYVSAHANQARITTFPLADGKISVTEKDFDKFMKNSAITTIYSNDVITFAREKGLFKGEDKNFSFSDTYNPVDFGGAVKPPFDNITCNGFNLTDWAQKMNENSAQINLDWLILFYNELSEKNQFFNSFFEKLAGTAELRKQIEQGLSAEQIRETWQPELKEYKRIRKKYLIYTDIE